MAKRLEINKAWCKGCGVCVAFCPKKVLKIESGKADIVNDGNCLRCGVCENLCPDFAIYLVNEEDEKNG